jgi:hypothetical protein
MNASETTPNERGPPRRVPRARPDQPTLRVHHRRGLIVASGFTIHRQLFSRKRSSRLPRLFSVP